MALFLGISQFFLYLVPFSVLIISRSTLFPFIVGKNIYFRFMVEIALFFFILYVVFERPHTNESNKSIGRGHWKSWLFWAVTVFVAIFSIAGAFGVDATNSFWANFERGEGIFEMWHYYLFFVLCVLALYEYKDWRRLFLFSIFSSIGLTFYGFLQYFGVSGVVSSGTDRIQGTLGNPAYVGAYLIFIMFYVAHLFIDEKRKWMKGFLILSFIMFVVGFFLTQTRGSLLGLGAGAFSGLLYLIWKSPSSHFRKFSIYSFLVLLAGVAFVYYFRETPLIKDLPFARIFKIDLHESGAQTRFWTWGSAVKGFYERPIIGWGPENFSRVFDKYFDTRHFVSPKAVGQQLWFDRAHNNFLEYLIQAGLLGLISYLFIFILYFVKILKTGFDKKDSIFSESLKNALLVFVMMAYLVQSFILFDVLSIYINLFLILAFAVFKFSNENESGNLLKNNGKLPYRK